MQPARIEQVCCTMLRGRVCLDIVVGDRALSYRNQPPKSASPPPQIYAHRFIRSSRRHPSCSNRPAAAAAAAAAGPRRHSCFLQRQLQQQLTLGRGQRTGRNAAARPSVATTAAAAEQSAASTSGASKLADMELLPIIDTQVSCCTEG